MDTFYKVPKSFGRRVAGRAGLALGTRSSCRWGSGRQSPSGKTSWWKQLALHAAWLGPCPLSSAGALMGKGPQSPFPA